jgi:signal transduction histidine kinase
MKLAFRMLPLPGKLLLITLLPLIFIVVLAVQLFFEKKQKISLIDDFRSQVNSSQLVMDLSQSLQAELRASFVELLKGRNDHALSVERDRTDSLRQLLRQNWRHRPEAFPTYTFLDQLSHTRSMVDRKVIQPDALTSYYINVVYRLQTMSMTGGNNELFFQNINNHLASEKSLSQLITFYGIIRLNIYNVLYEEAHGEGTLYGLRGVYDIYKSFERELVATAAPGVRERFKTLQNDSLAFLNRSYIDNLFARNSFDNTHSAETWWQESTIYLDSLEAMRTTIKQKIDEGIQLIYDREKRQQRRTVIYVLILLAVTAAIIMYAIHTINQMLHEIRKAAKKIATGGIGVSLGQYPHDVTGSLAYSISRLDESHTALAVAANEIGKGNFHIPIQPRSKKDVLGAALRKMKGDLQKLTEEVKQRQREITQGVFTGQEKERTRIGAELHDNINQLLTSAKLYLSVVKRNPQNAEELVKKADEILAMSIEEIRKLSKDLVSPSLRTSLKRSLQDLVADMLIASDITFTVEVNNVDEDALSEQMKVTIYRIVQEQMKNVLKYSEAQSVIIKLDSKMNFIDLLIEDDGKGFDPDASRRGIGINNIINRVQAFDGYIKIESAPNEGCKIIARISISAASKASL